MPAHVFAGDRFKGRVCRHCPKAIFLWLSFRDHVCLSVRNLRLDLLRLVSLIEIHISLILALALEGVFEIVLMFNILSVDVGI